MAITPPLTQPPSARRTHYPPRLCLTPSLSPFPLKLCSEATWKKRLRVSGSRTWDECRMPRPFSTNQGNLLWAQEHAQNSPQASSINVYCRFASVQALGQGEMTQQMSCRTVQLKYKVVFLCQWKITFFVLYHLLRWTPKCSCYFFVPKPKGSACPVLGSTWLSFCIRNEQAIFADVTLPATLCLQLNHVADIFLPLFPCTLIWGLDCCSSSSIHDCIYKSTLSSLFW